MKDFGDLNPGTIAENVGERYEEYAIPGAAFKRDLYSRSKYFFLRTGNSTSHKKLSNKDYCKQVGGELLRYLVTHLPASIFKEFVLQMGEWDKGCNNYLRSKKC